MLKKRIDKNQIIWKSTLAAFFLTLSLTVSFFEIKVTLPSGAEFDLRLFDTIFILLSVSIIGLRYSLFVCIIQPWLHLAIDGDHTPLSILFYSISNVLIATAFSLIYIKLFKADNISWKTHKYKKSISMFIAFLAILLIGSITEYTGIALAPIVYHQRGLANTTTEFLEFFFILFGIYIGKYTLVLFMYSLIRSKVYPLLRKMQTKTDKTNNNVYKN